MAMTVGTKGWFSRTGARTVSKIRQSGASQFETTKRKAHWGKKRSWPVANHQKILRRHNAHSWMGWLGVTDGEAGNPWTSAQGECLCMSCARLQAAISGVWRCVIFAIFSPQKKTRRWRPWRDESTKMEPSPGAGLGESRKGLPAAHGSLRVWLSPTNACRCPGELCSWDSSGPHPAGRPHRKGWSSSPRCT